MPYSKFTHLGFGLGFRSCHYDQILESRPKSIDWLEVISENFMNIGGKPRRVLEEARARYPIAIHGVGLSIGSPEPINATYLRQLRDLVTWLNPALISDHLCFTTVKNHNSHDLLPIPYTRTTLERLIARVDEVQQFLGRRFLLENPSAYVAFAGDNYTESEFLAELVTQTGCGILLDVNNLYVNHKNIGLDPYSYLQTLPTQSVGQIHLAGHSVETNDLGTVLIDTHDHNINDQVWSLYAEAAKKWPQASPMIEWDDKIPELSTLLSLLDKARSITCDTTPIQGQHSSLRSFDGKLSDDTPLLQLFSLATSPNEITTDDPRLHALNDTLPVPRQLGALVYHNAYFARLRDVLKSEFPTLQGVTTEDGFDAIVSNYLQVHPPTEADIGQVGKHLSQYLEHHEIANFDFGVPMSALADIAVLDRLRSAAFTDLDNTPSLSKHVLVEVSPEQWDILKLKFNPTLRLYDSRFDIAPVWQAINQGLSPQAPEPRATSIAVWRRDESVIHETKSAAEIQLIKHLLQQHTFSSAVHMPLDGRGETLEEKSNFALQKLIQWFDQGLITEIYF